MKLKKRKSMFWTYSIGIFLVTLFALIVLFSMLFERNARAAAVNPLLSSSQDTDDTGLIKPKDLILRVDIENYIRQKFGKDGERAVKVSFCESGTDPTKFNLNKGHSLDRGLFMINAKYHPEVTTECAFNARCAVDAAYNIYVKNHGFGAWEASRSCWDK